MNTSQGSAISQALSRWSILLMAAMMLYALASGTAAENALGIPDSEYNALVALYNATGGPNWLDNTNWLTDELPWHGVEIESGHVISIDLSCNYLGGQLPDEICDLPWLLYLDLDQMCGPRMGGSIPSRIGNLTNLVHLDLGDNALTGAIPAGIANLTNLSHLDLSYNCLTGCIPADIGNLASLSILNLFGNHLTGPIPASVGQLTQLLRLSLGGNQLTGPIPSEIGSSQNLEELSLDWNQLEGPIPVDICSLPALRDLNLSSNRLTSVPDEIGNLSKLTLLQLSYNRFTAIPSSIGNLSKLTQLEIGYNDLASIPAQIGDLPNLLRLGLGGLKLTSLPAWITRLSTLQILSLDENNLRSIPTEIASLPNLEGLGLYANEITEVPPWIGGLSKLWWLSLSHNKLTSLPSEMGSLGLGSLDLDNNEFSSIPPAIASLPNLHSLSLSGNVIAEIPSWIGSLSKLRYLHLGSNRLVGEVPSAITGLQDIWDLTLWYNGLWSSDSDVLAFLDQKSGGWKWSQTVPPTDVSAQIVQPGYAIVSWTPIGYQEDGGYYEVGVSTTPGGPYTFSDRNRSASKRASSVLVVGDLSAPSLYFVVRTFTPAGEHNRSPLTSPLSPEVSANGSGLGMAIGQAKLLPDGETVVIPIVPAVMGWLETPETIKAYIEQWDRSSGIAIRLPTSMAPDNGEDDDKGVSAVSLTGTMATKDGERYIDVSSIEFYYGDDHLIRPLGIANLTGARGHDFSGMYVKTWGKVIESPTYSGGANPNSFRMSDASGEFTVLRPQGYSEFGGDRLLIPTIDAFIPVRGVCSGILGEKLLYHEPGYEAWRLSSRTSGLEITGYACIEDNFSLATAMEISGPGISGWQPMMPDEDEEWGHVDWRWSWTIPNPLPPAPVEYLFRITENGQSSIYKSWITGFITELPTNLSPASGATVSGPLTFSWTLPSTGGPFESRVTLRSGGASYDFWSKGGIHGSSYTYDGPALSGWYSWRVEVFDRDGNTCLSEWTSFEYSGPPPSPSEAP